MTSTQAINEMAVKLAKTGNWRLRQELGTLTETMSSEIVPFSLQIEERRHRDAADYMLGAYGSAKELIAIMDRWFPEIAEIEEV